MSRCKCGRYCAHIWVGFGRFLKLEHAECNVCAAKREMTATLKREVMIQEWHRDMERFMG